MERYSKVRFGKSLYRTYEFPSEDSIASWIVGLMKLDNLTPWEKNFIERLRQRVTFHGPKYISEPEVKKLEEIYAERSPS